MKPMKVKLEIFERKKICRIWDEKKGEEGIKLLDYDKSRLKREGNESGAKNVTN